jgi:hypothetical protein
LSDALSKRERVEIAAHLDACADRFALVASLAESLTPPVVANADPSVGETSTPRRILRSNARSPPADLTRS